MNFLLRMADRKVRDDDDDDGDGDGDGILSDHLPTGWQL